MKIRAGNRFDSRYQIRIAQALASKGAHVYVNGRTQERVDAAMVAIRSHATTARVDGIAAEFQVRPVLRL